MGAASSIKTYIYLSYPKLDANIEELKNTLINLNYNVLDSSLTSEHVKEKNISELDSIVSNYLLIIPLQIICISPETTKSIIQTLEMNNTPVDSNIIYLMLDSKYTPSTNFELNTLIRNKKHTPIWFPFYDENTIFETKNKIITILMNKYNNDI
jgi:hypothetical protein